MRNAAREARREALCAMDFILDSGVLIRVSQRSCRYLLTLASAVKTDWVYWRDVRLEVGETS